MFFNDDCFVGKHELEKVKKEMTSTTDDFDYYLQALEVLPS